MRTLDLGIVREQIGSVKVGKKTLVVFEPTIGQQLTHAKETRKWRAYIDKAQKDNVSGEEFVKERNSWFLREVQIFIPEFTQDDYEMITFAERVRILNLCFGEEETSTEGEPQKKKPIKKKAKKPTGK
jgi:hypothetical protein